MKGNKLKLLTLKTLSFIGIFLLNRTLTLGFIFMHTALLKIVKIIFFTNVSPPYPYPSFSNFVVSPYPYPVSVLPSLLVVDQGVF